MRIAFVKAMLFVFLAFGSLPARATAGITDMTDLWWVPAESGWGLSINHQGRTLVATFYAYNPSESTTTSSILAVIH